MYGICVSTPLSDPPQHWVIGVLGDGSIRTGFEPRPHRTRNSRQPVGPGLITGTCSYLGSTRVVDCPYPCSSGDGRTGSEKAVSFSNQCHPCRECEFGSQARMHMFCAIQHVWGPGRRWRLAVGCCCRCPEYRYSILYSVQYNHLDVDCYTRDIQSGVQKGGRSCHPCSCLVVLTWRSRFPRAFRPTLGRCDTVTLTPADLGTGLRGSRRAGQCRAPASFFASIQPSGLAPWQQQSLPGHLASCISHPSLPFLLGGVHT